MQELLPYIPEGATEIAPNLTVVRNNNGWTYMHCMLPVFSHKASDTRLFKMITSSFILQGVCRNIDIQNAFGVSKSSIIRNVKRYKENGSDAFLKKTPQTKRSSKVFTDEKIAEAETLLSQGFRRSEVASKINIKYSTLNKAILGGRVVIPEEDTRKSVSSETTDKSDRSRADEIAADEFGVACTRVVERSYAALGLLNTAESRFERCNDVTNGGVLTALPALVSNGLYHEIDTCFGEFKGYYSVTHIITCLGFMALCRIKTVEQLRWQPPGEWGKLMGLDRIPEVRCLREKMAALAEDGAAEKWGELLSRNWMDASPDLAGVLYVDGHVRLYDGKEKLPKQYVSRERLCLKGVMDFWVNDKLGQPFFVVRTAVNHGMLKVLRDNIVPRLLRDVPNQPTEEMLNNDLYLHRFIIVFDREGYSPKFAKEMWDKHRIACITYHKYPKGDWGEEEFEEVDVTLVHGETVSMKLAERGSLIGTGKDAVWVKEVRKLTKSGHQTSIVSTAYGMLHTVLAVLIFARWCQENFFNYMMKHFAIDLLSDYNKVSVPDTETVISPDWRTLDREINSLNGKLKTKTSRFGTLNLHPAEEDDSKAYDDWLELKQELAEEITVLEGMIERKKKDRKGISKHIKVVDLPEDETFQQLASSRKNLVDTVKMVAYRAETAMASTIVKECGALEQARALVRDVFTSEADLIPDPEAGRLTVRLHNLSTRALDSKLDALLKVLNEAEVKFPGTTLTLQYRRIGESGDDGPINDLGDGSPASGSQSGVNNVSP